MKLTDLSSSLDRSAHKDSNKNLFFIFLMFIQIFMDFISLNKFLKYLNK
jgi:hypothetical protein